MELKIAIAQSNFCVGDLMGNADKIINLAKEAKNKEQADLTIFPELALTGYPPEDLILRPGFHEKVSDCLEKIVSALDRETIVFGFPELVDGAIFNSAAVVGQNTLITSYKKQELPNYAVFDEKRYFSPGNEAVLFKLKNINIGLSVCEDIWVPCSP